MAKIGKTPTCQGSHNGTRALERGRKAQKRGAQKANKKPDRRDSEKYDRASRPQSQQQEELTKQAKQRLHDTKIEMFLGDRSRRQRKTTSRDAIDETPQQRRPKQTMDNNILDVCNDKGRTTSIQRRFNVCKVFAHNIMSYSWEQKKEGANSIGRQV